MRPAAFFRPQAGRGRWVSAAAGRNILTGKNSKEGTLWKIKKKEPKISQMHLRGKNKEKLVKIS
jgi:hypothetical protein